MDLGLTGKRIAVTGGSSGIGREAVRVLAREGARVAVGYHNNKQAAEAVVSGIPGGGGRVFPWALDLGDPGSLATAAAELEATWKGLDGLVHAAVAWPEPSWPPSFLGTSPKAWRETLEVNFAGTIELVQRALPLLQASKASRIVLLSSGVAEYGMAGEEVYAAAKAALAGFMRCLAREFGPSGLLVNVVMPGLTLTERCIASVPEAVREGVAAQSSSGRLSTPEDVATLLAYLVSAANGNITGEVIRVSGGV